MAFNPNLPAAHAPIVSQELRDQFNALKALIDAQAAQIAALTPAVESSQANDGRRERGNQGEQLGQLERRGFFGHAALRPAHSKRGVFDRLQVERPDRRAAPAVGWLGQWPVAAATAELRSRLVSGRFTERDGSGRPLRSNKMRRKCPSRELTARRTFPNLNSR